MEVSKPSSEDRLLLITDMISEAKTNIAKKGSFYFLLWGWVLIFANLGHYLIDQFSLYEHPYIVWLVTIPAVISTVVYTKRKQRDAHVISHYDRIYGQVWIAVAITTTITLIFMYKINFYHNAVILGISGVGTYISGHLLRFKPLIWGGVVLFASAIIAFNVAVHNQYLVAAIALLFGYIIPGYILKKAERERI